MAKKAQETEVKQDEQEVQETEVKQDVTQPGGRYLVGGVLVDCDGKQIEE